MRLPRDREVDGMRQCYSFRHIIQIRDCSEKCQLLNAGRIVMTAKTIH